MKSKLISQLEEVLPKKMYIPDEIRLLYQWIEDNGFYRDEGSLRYGFLYPEEALRRSWTKTEREGGTIINFSAIGAKLFKILVWWHG